MQTGIWQEVPTHLFSKGIQQIPYDVTWPFSTKQHGQISQTSNICQRIRNLKRYYSSNNFEQWRHWKKPQCISRSSTIIKSLNSLHKLFVANDSHSSTCDNPSLIKTKCLSSKICFMVFLQQRKERSLIGSRLQDPPSMTGIPFGGQLSGQLASGEIKWSSSQRVSYILE